MGRLLYKRRESATQIRRLSGQSPSLFSRFGRPSRRIVCSSPDWLTSFIVQASAPNRRLRSRLNRQTQRSLGVRPPTRWSQSVGRPVRIGASITGRKGAMIFSYSSPLGKAGRGLAFLNRTVIDAPVLRIDFCWGCPVTAPRGCASDSPRHGQPLWPAHSASSARSCSIASSPLNRT